MSRSYKKYPKVKAYESGKFGKKQANRTIRHLPINVEIPNGRSFKKLYESSNIYDYSFTEFKEWVVEKWQSNQKDSLYGVKNGIHWYDNDTLEEALADWKKFYKCK